MPTSHPYEKPEEAVRSPCPALNALGNHGFINRDGRHIKLGDLVRALVHVYNLSEELATFLAGMGILLCGDVLKLEVDLDKLARHNRIEHDFSLVHADAKEGEEYAPTSVDEERYDQLMTVNNTDGKEKSYLTLDDFIQHRHNLMGDKEFDKIHGPVASGEILMIMDEFGEEVTKKNDKGDEKKEIRVKKEYMKSWLHDEMLPREQGWREASKQIGLRRLNKEQQEYKKRVDELLEHDKKGTLDEFKKSVEKYGGKLMDEIRKTIDRAVDCPHIFHAVASTKE